jgi:tagatose 6-phosphate kinase
VILTCTPNPALDVSYHVDRIVPGATHRVRSVLERAGGKGFNVSRVLHQLGVATLATGPVGGVLGDSLRADLADSGLPHELLPVGGATRMTVAVVADDPPDATLFTEPGTAMSEKDWDRLLGLVAGHLPGAGALVCSGSLPPGAPVEAYARFVALARGSGVPVLVDVGGEPLVAAARAGADVLKPNAEELRSATGVDDPVAGARQLLAAGAGAVVVSLGAAGMVAVTGAGAWRARGPRVDGNPTGAGDAAVAALAEATAAGRSWPRRVAAAVAWSAAAVAAPAAGAVVPELLDTEVEVVEL